MQNKELTPQEQQKVQDLIHNELAELEGNELAGWSIGKLKAFCERHGIKAAKFTRPRLEYHVRKIQRYEGMDYDAGE